MNIDFMNDTEYVEVCGSRTVLDVASTLISIFDRHESGSHEVKTVGRVSDLKAIKKEISCLQSDLRDSKKLCGFFWKTALYLQKRQSAAQRRMDQLKRQEKEQERLRVAFKAFIRGPALPKEITDTVLSQFCNYTRLRREGPRVYVNGLVPLAVYNPSLLLPHYEQKFGAEWTLEDIAEAELKMTVLEDAALTNHVKLHVSLRASSGASLRPLMKYPHQWKRLDINVDRFDMDDFIGVFKPCLLHLEELVVKFDSVTSSRVALPPNSCPRLRTADLDFNTLSVFFDPGLLNSITRLTVRFIGKHDFPNLDAFKKALNDLPLVLSRLSRLRELDVWDSDCDRTDMEGLQRVHSTSLHSLKVGNASSSINIAIIFLELFVDCPVDHVDVHADALEEAERLFGDAQHVTFRGSFPDFLCQRKQNGSIAFPKMNQMGLYDYFTGYDRLQVRHRLLESVRMRYEEPTVCSVGHLRIPKDVVTIFGIGKQFQRELEEYVPSLVLF